MIENVLFDFGNVIIYWDSRKAFTGSYPEEQITQWYGEVDFDRINQENDEGRSWDDCIRELRAKGIEEKWVEMAQHYFDNFDKTLWGRVPGSDELILDLKRAGIHVWGLTNWSEDMYGIMASHTPIVAEFEDVVVSGEVKMVKPNLDIYEYAIKQFGIDPAKSIFADDRSENLAPAASLGMQVHEFRTTDAFRKVLQSQGVPI